MARLMEESLSHSDFGFYLISYLYHNTARVVPSRAVGASLELESKHHLGYEYCVLAPNSALSFNAFDLYYALVIVPYPCYAKI